MRSTTGWQSLDGTTALQRVPIERRDLRPDDVAVRVDYCGVCHSDLHRIHGMLGEKDLVPGHEATGVVTAVGAEVTGFAPGERVAIGTIIDSCGVCPMCRIGQENYCYEGPTTTYGGAAQTKGAYSREYILREKFAFHLPEGLEPAAAAPLLCAGVTVWEPIRAAGVGSGSKVGVVGLGGLGHLAVKIAAALGAEVTVLSRTADKADDARRLGASDLLVTTDEAQLEQARGRFDLIVDTVSAEHELPPLLRMLALDGTLSVVGNPLMAGPRILDLVTGRHRLTSSGTGGLRQTVEMLEFCAENGITADVEVLPSARVQEALDRLERGDVHYRFVLDMSDLDEQAA
ncbi:MAG TPA: NAD(P)-dependent alcohol dehydrogenase [Pseudolysinimonas sp.]|nr:NAD(P)-dependent alcohol dehydrogenase [Pseudolysinimonas sp.]